MSEAINSKSDANTKRRQLDLPFDQYQRYRIVTDVIGKLREASRPLRILDVGGAEGIILHFLPDDQVTILDQTEAEGVPGFVQGDATALPFEDETYDYVVSVDVYEHIEPGARERYLSELRRVSCKGVLLAAPFDTDAVRDAEQAANAFHRSVHLAENVWLKEHADNGLPDLVEAGRFFEEHGDSVSILPNGYLPHWLAMMCLTFYSPKLGEAFSGVADQVNTFYNASMYEWDNTEPSYRHLLVSLKEPPDANLEELVSANHDPERTSRSSVLFGTLSAILPMAAEAKQFNTQTKQFNAQTAQYEKRISQVQRALARKEAQSRALARKEAQSSAQLDQYSAQLEQYKKHLSQTEALLARKQAQINDLSRRLAERIGAENDHQVQMERRINKLQQAHSNLKQQVTSLNRQKDQVQQQLTGITNSRAWRLLTVLHKLRTGRIVRPD